MLVPLLLALSAGPPTPVPFDPAPYRALIEREMKRSGVPGAAVAVVKGGKVVLLEGFGVRERGKPGRVTPDTIFPICSTTKAFTTALLAMQVAEGKAAWGDKVRQHLDWFRLSDELADREVTLRDLVSHQTGMPRHDFTWVAYDDGEEAVVRRWMKGKKAHSFRERFDYSNVPFTTAGLIAGRIDGTTWAEATRKRIFEPLRMNASLCSARQAKLLADRMTPHNRRPGEKEPVPLEWWDSDAVAAAGMIHSSARDLSNWMIFHLGDGYFDGKRLLPAGELRATRTPAVVCSFGENNAYLPSPFMRHHSYALGWLVMDYRGATCVHHDGGLPGVVTFCALLPEKDCGVFVLSNLDKDWFCGAVGYGIFDRLLGLPPEDWGERFARADAKLREIQQKAIQKREQERKKDTKPSLPLADYTGTYVEPAYGPVKVTVEDGKLHLHLGRLKYRLDHYHFDTFSAALAAPNAWARLIDRPEDAVFRLSAKGEVEVLTFYGQEFKRQKPKE
jgi:CubicO group peptidase (beta-lactamase class C family)